MKTLREHVPRREVVEAYLQYDASKKQSPLPSTDGWDWTDPNAIDSWLKASGFKIGILAGFVEWTQVALTLEDLRDCAVANTVSRGGPRDLRGLERKGLLRDPEGPRSWLAKTTAGLPLDPTELFVLRTAVDCEKPATWYLEDGSGRAASIVFHSAACDPGTPIAYGYLGVVPDCASRFMQDQFPSLLAGHAKAQSH